MLFDESKLLMPLGTSNPSDKCPNSALLPEKPDSFTERREHLISVFTVFHLIPMRVRVIFGALCNVAGIPGLIRNCDYEGGITDASIRVRVGEMYTVITVNGLDIYFHRTTGEIDGVGGFTADCKGRPVHSAMQSPVQPLCSPPPIHK